MFAVLEKELRSFFSTLTGPIVIAVYLILTASFLWLIPGENNVLWGGYANLDGLFALAPWLFLFLVPAITMRTFSDEYRQGTVEILRTRPVHPYSIVVAKYLASLIIVLISLLFTLFYLLAVCYLGTPFANIDLGGFFGSFIGLIFLACLYTAIGVFFSSLSDNPIISFVGSAFLCFIFYYGFEMLSFLPNNVNVKDFISSMGIASHYDSMSRGVIDFSDIWYFITISQFFLLITFRKRFPIKLLAVAFGLVLTNIFASSIVLRLDLTAEKRHSISESTKNLLKNQEKGVKVDVYLDGDMNVGFLRLKKSVQYILDEMNRYAEVGIKVEFTDLLSDATSEKERNQIMSKMQRKGLSPTMVHDYDNSGNTLQKVIFPWAVFSCAGDTINVPLLQNIAGRSGDENLNSSIENLEYAFTDALRIFTQKEVVKVAFLEGHGEAEEHFVYSLTESLSRYYQVDRGVLGDDPNILNDYKVVIIAEPQTEFSESDKYILDQYIMRGGRVIWLVDGVATNGEIGKPNDLGLTDQLFTYGVRIQPMMLLDIQCATVPINTSMEGQVPNFVPMPWYYSPLLMPMPEHAITRNIAPIKAEFASYIEKVGENDSVSGTVLLCTSSKTALEKAPMSLRADIVNLSPESPYFAYSYMPVAVLLEGKFKSVYANRLAPENIITGGKKPIKQSENTKMLVVADGSIALNSLQGFASGYEPLPLGYDKYMKMQFGNNDFMLNAVNYLADDSDWMQLRNKKISLRILDKEKIARNGEFWKWFCITVPVLLLIIFSVGFQIVRKNQNTK
jgi:ABC-2 type transport system permease protein